MYAQVLQNLSFNYVLQARLARAGACLSSSAAAQPVQRPPELCWLTSNHLGVYLTDQLSCRLWVCKHAAIHKHCAANVQQVPLSALHRKAHVFSSCVHLASHFETYV